MIRASAPKSCHRLGRVLQIGTVARNEDQPGKIACEAHGGGLADALAGACHNCNRIRHFDGSLIVKGISPVAHRLPQSDPV